MAAPARMVIDDSNMQKRLLGIRNELGKRGAKEAAIVLVEEFRNRMIRMAPRDTNRYLRGWMEACTKAGVPTPLPPIKNSSRQAEYISALQSQLAFWREFYSRELGIRAAWYDNDPTKKRGPHFRKLESRIRKAERRMKAAEDALAAAMLNEGVIVIDGGWEALRGAHRIDKAKPLSKRGATVRWRYYGGKGAVRTNANGVAWIELSNEEPHAQILERKGHYARMASLGMAGGRLAVMVGKRMVKSSKRYGVASAG